MRTLVIGDIHGGLKGLQQALNRANINPEDQLIFLGDYVDGWSESAETVSFLIGLSAENNCVFLKGNHDELCYHYLAKNEKPLQWKQQGGQSSIDSYEKVNRRAKEIHKNFFDNLLDYHIDTENRLFIHAGFQNPKGPKFEYHKTAYYWDRTLWEMALATDINLKKDSPIYPQRLKLFKEIYIGHTPVTRLGKTTPHNAQGVWNIDTGAAYKGPVTILDIHTKEFWQSDPVWTLYPDENGRNVI